MSWEEYELLAMRPGWKIEYRNGRAQYSPRHYFAVTRVKVEPRAVKSQLPIKPVTLAYQASLAEAYFEAFRDTFDYCDWEVGQIVESTNKCIREFLSGKRGEPLAASQMAVDESSDKFTGKVAGAAMIKRGSDGFPLLDFLFVRQEWQRCGLATALVASAINELHRAGESVLQSCYRLGNDESVAWHNRFGFVEEPDLRIAQLYLSCTYHELWRREKMGNLTAAERARLKTECEGLRKRVDELQAIEDKLGFEAVSPMYRHT